MKYFIDTEFIEGSQDNTFLGIKYGETKPTIDLISIGIVGEEQCELPRTNDCDKESPCRCCSRYNSRKYYAISKDFNLRAAWKNEWVRENVLKSIMQDLCYANTEEVREWFSGKFTINDCKKLINKYGKTNKQIAQEIVDFVYPLSSIEVPSKNPEFYGYYSDYDWVVFCQLFVTMMDLPKGFPMFAFDLKQILDEKAKMFIREACEFDKYDSTTKEGNLKILTEHHNYPKQTNEHNALADAKWNYELYKFLNTI